MLQATREQNHTRPITSKQKLHKYVSICVGCLLMFIATFPLAYWRVMQSKKYDAGAFNSLTPEQSQKSDFKVDR